MRALGMLIVLGLAGPAIAQPPAGKQAAEREYTEGQARYRAGEFQAAAEKFLHAFDLDPDPVYLYNAAQAYRFAKMCLDAAMYYQKFLTTTPATAPNRDKAERFRDEMDECAKSQTLVQPDHAQAQPPPAADHPRSPLMPLPPRDRDTGHRTLGLALGGAGIVGLGVGLYFTHDVGSVGDAEDRCAMLPGSCDTARVNYLHDRGNRDNLAQAVAYPIGGAALVAGVVLYVLGRDHDERAVSVVPTRGGAAVTWSF